MSPFELLRPSSLDEALSILAQPDFNGRPVSGCTAISLMRRAGVLNVDALVSLERLKPGLSRIEVTASGELRADALVTLGELERHPAAMASHPLLGQTFHTLANPRVRNVAMLGGYLANGDPHMDLPPVLSALNARVKVRSVRGEREIPVDALYQGYYETAMAADELVVQLIVPAQPRYAHYQKVTTRARHDWPTLGIAAAFEQQGDVLSSVRVFIGAATDRPTRLAGVESVVTGAPWNEALVQRCCEVAVGEVDLIADSHGSSEYKVALLRAYLPEVFERARQAPAPQRER